jgi:hypothetical protein
MPTLTNVQGTLYDSLGNIINTGVLTIKLQQSIISVDGTVVSPSPQTINLASTAGVVNVNLYATIGATPSGVYYFVEYDPNPADLTKPTRLKDGYWRNWWAVPNTGSLVTLGSFSVTTRR